MKFLVFGVCLLLITCCQHSIENPTADFSPPKKLGTVKTKKLKEVSGIAASINNPGYIWGHNDSGNEPDVYLFDEKLNIKLTCSLKGVENRDWEDMTIGPGPDSSKTYLYIGDIGDNSEKRKLKIIYRFEEPVLDTAINKIEITDFETLVFDLAGEKKDVETLMIDPVSKDLFVVSKREEPVWLYQLKSPSFNGDTITAIKALSLPMTQIVGGDISSDGKKVLLKNYEHIYYWNNSSGKPLLEALAEKPFEVNYEIEPQGEAISWDHPMKGFFTLSERNLGKDSFLYYYPTK